jgi:hypothetical protein
MYGVIIEKHPISIAALVQVLAYVTYASVWLLETSARHCGHPFAAIPLLQNQQLLLRLKAKVMIEPTELMAKATGVPPHVRQMILMTCSLGVSILLGKRFGTLNALSRSFSVILFVTGTQDWIPQYFLRSFQRYPLKVIQTPKGLLMKDSFCNSDRCWQ